MHCGLGDCSLRKDRGGLEEGAELRGLRDEDMKRWVNDHLGLLVTIFLLLAGVVAFGGFIGFAIKER